MGLKLSRKKGERIYIKRGDRIIAEVEVSKIRGNMVFLYIDADQDLYITRDKDWKGSRHDTSGERSDKKVPV